MKKFIITSILISLMSGGLSLMAQAPKDDYLGLPGDNLNLYAVMKLFQESKTLEEFERNLNDPNSEINNLDLNGDNMTDYIRVIDNVDGDVHNIVMQVPISARENQDVAVFTVQRFQNGQVQIQLTGDEDLYGRNYIIEPIYDDNLAQTPNPGYFGNQPVIVTRTTGFEISTWPLVRFIFLPNYVVWHSSWRWEYYPSYWHPWHPSYWHYYYGYHYNDYNYYYGHYRRWDTHRYTHWNDTYYTSRRAYSPHVAERIHAGTFKTTYSHPEQRRDGEAFYRTHQNQDNRRSDNSNITTQPRNSRQVTNRNTRSSADRNTSVRQPRQNQGNNVTTNPGSGDTRSVSRRSQTRSSSRTVTNPQSGQQVNSNQNSGQPKNTTVSSDNRRKTKASKSETTVKQDRKTRRAERKTETNGPGR